MQIEIKDAKKKDMHLILGLLHELGRPKPNDADEESLFEHKIKQYLSDNDKQILVAWIDSEIAGLVSMMILPRLNRVTPELYVPELIVRDEYRRHGIGQKLINSCIMMAKKKKCHRIRLESGNDRKESHLFYKDLGFSQHALSFIKEIK